jgi:hypothetical protein
MAQIVSEKHKVSYTPIIIGLVTLVLLLIGYLYLNRAQTSGSQESQASVEAKSYVKNLELTDVKMQAAENFMQQQVVEVDGNITNRGQRALEAIDVFCLFYSVNGQMIHRERVAVVRAKGKPLGPNETRAFRLPFDSLPANWNQAMPHLVVAQIKFAQ